MSVRDPICNLLLLVTEALTAHVHGDDKLAQELLNLAFAKRLVLERMYGQGVAKPGKDESDDAT